ncbi:low molecular weight protein-tyrosine-phosphatase [Motilimonas pumila]|uniref:Low molecular weight phosphotyrosine protein phosphatase n=1 Tax=Motilimonas pumila TaxID=2303987 RepID=A0A418YCJ3_9GAMM|nr:low molecular weight protein-tyrosine-phosphatase [Motilimonas pumila]RJG42240.1 low molecular weight phosphotyrosine protein phosphatase [Motilimonas pumila]
MTQPVAILMVCMGNICRSPTAEAVMRFKAKQQGIAVTLDSAGTISAHKGEKPDQRSMVAGQARGYDFSGIRSRKVKPSDFASFDIILAADHQNITDLLAICPPEFTHKVSLLLSHTEQSMDEVPDPYYGGVKGFEKVLDLIEQGCEGVLKKISMKIT